MLQHRFVLAVLLIGCAARARLELPPPAPPIEAAADLRVYLLWSAPVDLDLYLTDPTWETVYFGNTPSRSGGRLERAEGCVGAGAPSTFTEIARIPQPAPGTYRVGVDFIDACGTKIEQTSFRVVAAINGVTREATGVAKLNVFQPIVLELELTPRADGSKAFRYGKHSLPLMTLSVR